jgi:hypothetical protein
MKKLPVILLILLAVSLTAFARPVKRITFPKGATKVSVSAYLNGYKDSQIFLIKLRKGQKMTLDATRSVSLFISNPNGEDVSDMDLSCHSRQTVEKTTSGDYKIKAIQCGKADEWKGSFKLTVKVVNETSAILAVKNAESNKNSPPIQNGIDISFSDKIDQAKKEFEASPTKANAKNNLASAYFERAFALTAAAQYRAALGDFRKGLKLNPENKEAKEMRDQIINIFTSLGREPPKEGEESAPIIKNPLF